MAGTSNTSSLADPVLLEKIDKLFELKVGDYVALPQLLVVGDQSRRETTTTVSVSVIPAVNAQPEHVEKLCKWKKDDIDLLDSGKLADVLKEICGPTQEHLSIIDVLGIFRNTTPGVTTKEDIALVRDMVTSYMENPRSALLAVIPANVDIGTQEILEMAKISDPKGQRTLGVLTKPDLVDKGAELDVVRIIEGKSHPLNLGWCIVRNSGQQHLNDSAGDRHGREKVFFSKEEPWNKVSKDRVGIEALKLRLVDVLSELIGREFPNVRLDINKRLAVCKRDLEKMGPSRETRDQQYKYLLDLACRYQAVTSQALKAGYGDDLFDDSPGLKLANSVVLRNEDFSMDVAEKGHTYNFMEEVSPTVAAVPFGSTSTNAVVPFGSTSTNAAITFGSTSTKDDEDPVPVRYELCDPELEDLLQDSCDIIKPKKTGIKAWLEDIYKSSRGFELGTFDVSLLTVVWRKQSANWDALAMGYINDIVSLGHGYTTEVLSTISKNESIRRAISAVLLELLTERYKRGIDHAKMILAVERQGTPLTANHYFAENLEKCRKERVKSEMEKHQLHHASVGWYVKTDAIVRGTTTSSNLEHTICDIHDILKSYYKVARKRFVDNVMMQAADFHLVTSPDSPIKVFTPAFVSDLTTEQLETIAGEDGTTKRKRADLKREIESLGKGKRML
ncbi:hypothetical protein P7C71_g2147, partial [Lecanoromycetidae sp. Uapishka_2]